MDLRDYLKNKKLLADGAFGTYFFRKNETGEEIPEFSNLSNPNAVKAIHKEYIEAGARLIRTNTFAANTVVLKCSKEMCTDILKAGYKIAAEAAQESKKEVFVAADIGQIPQEVFQEEPDISKEYQDMIDSFIECGAEIFLFETFSELKYIKKFVPYIKERCRNAFIGAQFCLNRYGYTNSGISAMRLLQGAAELKDLDAVGFNCGIGSGHLYEILKKMKPVTNQFILAMPNSGYPQMLQNRMVYHDNTKYFAKKMGKIADLNVSIIGGCCGTTPDYIKELKRTVNFQQNIKKIEVVEKKVIEIMEPKKNSFWNKLYYGEKVIAVELDPPYDAKVEKIMESANLLKAENVDLITFADSPMGRGRVDSILMSVKVMQEVEIPVMPHIACRDKNVIAMRAGILGGYVNNIRNYLIVTGDPVPSEERKTISGVFDFNSIHFMEYLKEMNREHFLEEPISYGGALNYGRPNIEIEIERMRKKKAAGASYFLTQPIFSQEDIERIQYIKTKINTKILCGIMPLISYKNAVFIKNEISGINVPQFVVDSYTPEMTKLEGERNGVRIAKEIMEKLDPVADGYYFMLPFNRVHLMHDLLKK